MRKRIAVLGAGNIGLAIAEGIRAAGLAEGRVIVTRKSNQFSKDEQDRFICLSDNLKAVADSNIVIVAVKPKQADELLQEIKGNLKPEQLLISVVTGVSFQRIEMILGQVAVARAMPNTAIEIRQSMTALAFNEQAKEHQPTVKEIFEAVGRTLIVPEEKFAEATGLFASGLAFAMKYMRGHQLTAIQHGFHENDALLVASQVMRGAAMLVQQGNRHPEVEIDKVTTPDGCTIAGLVELEMAGFISAILRGMRVCIERARKLLS